MHRFRASSKHPTRDQRATHDSRRRGGRNRARRTIGATKESAMQIGMIGLGRMGANMVHRLLAGHHQCVVFDRSPQVVEELARAKAIGTASIAELAKKLETPRAVWLMVPAAAV